ncbi:hypothetical protein IWX50DRAFT_621320 [Phyllosticta citricarpa]
MDERMDGWMNGSGVRVFCLPCLTLVSSFCQSVRPSPCQPSFLYRSYGHTASWASLSPRHAGGRGAVWSGGHGNEENGKKVDSGDGDATR